MKRKLLIQFLIIMAEDPLKYFMNKKEWIGNEVKKEENG